MKQINKIILSITMFSLLFIIQGCGEGKEVNQIDEVEGVKKNVNTKSIGELKISESEECGMQYDKLISKNKVDFSDCNFEAKSDSFQKKEVNEKNNNTVLIFDVSGSMAGLVDGKKKIDIAKESMYKFLDKIKGENVNLSVVVYGHKGSNTVSDKEMSCAGIEEIYYMGKLDNASIIKDKIKILNPTGWTPIADSFKKANEILSKYEGKNNNNSIILISDGKEMCGGNPVEEIKKLRNSNLHITANVIGFDVGGEDERQLKEVAQSGGGDYFSVNSVVDFENALEKHKEFMREFDYKMGNITMQLDDMGEFGEKYFECIMKLKEEESNVILDIYGYDKDDADDDRVVTKACASYSENKYYEDRYNEIELKLNTNFDDVMIDWKRANAFNKK